MRLCVSSCVCPRVGLFCFVLFCFVLFCFVLFCFVLFCFVSFRFGLVWFGLVWFGLCVCVFFVVVIVVEWFLIPQEKLLLERLTSACFHVLMVAGDERNIT